jgi:hypothetical protein
MYEYVYICMYLFMYSYISIEFISESDSSGQSSYGDKYSENDSTLWDSNSVTSRPRVLIAGGRGMGHI